MNTPVLFLIFNRPEETRRAFNAIRKVKPSRLYIGADGPRKNKREEIKLCDEARRVVTDIDWTCEVKTLFRDKNLGCKNAVSGAIGWFFDHEEEGIILEDDCLADPSFFTYCEKLLDKYRDHEQVMVISGDYFHGNNLQIPNSYFFSRYNHCWGWATWRSAWEKYDDNMSKWPDLKQSRWLYSIGDGYKDFQKYWEKILDKVYTGQVNSWAYRWTYSCWLNNGLTILPTKNLIKNIGYGKNSTNTKNKGEWISNIPLEKLSFPLKHPDEIERNKEADRWSDLNVFNTKKTIWTRIYAKAKYILKTISE